MLQEGCSGDRIRPHSSSRQVLRGWQYRLRPASDHPKGVDFFRAIHLIYSQFAAVGDVGFDAAVPLHILFRGGAGSPCRAERVRLEICSDWTGSFKGRFTGGSIRFLIIRMVFA